MQMTRVGSCSGEVESVVAMAVIGQYHGKDGSMNVYGVDIRMGVRNHSEALTLKVPCRDMTCVEPLTFAP